MSVINKTLPLNSFWANLLFIVVSLAGLNVISSYLYVRLDITEDKLYTLSEGTEKIMQKVERPLSIKLYFSKESENIPLAYKNYGYKVESLLKEYADLNSEHVTFEVFEPKPDSDEEVWANRYGLQSADLNFGERFFLGAAFVSGKRESTIPFFNVSRERYLEYDVTKGIYDTVFKGENTLGILTDLPMQGSQVPGQGGKWALIEELEQLYTLRFLEKGLAEIPPDINTLAIIHPRGFGDGDYYAVEQFMMRGGNLILLLDPFMRLDPALAQQAQAGRQQGPSSSSFGKLLDAWGIDYGKDRIVGDPGMGVLISSTLKYPFYMRLSPAEQGGSELIAVKELEEVILAEPGAFRLKPESELTMTPILKATEAAGEVNSFMALYSRPEQLVQSLKPNNKENVFAALFNGSFSGAFSERPSGSQASSPHLSESKAEGSLLLIADVDFLADQVSVQRFQFLGNSVYQPKNDNLSLFINMADFLGGSGDMIGIRSRGKFNRPLEVFDEMQNASRLEFEAAEKDLQNQLERIQNELSQLKPEEGTSTIRLTAEQTESIRNFKEEELKTQQQLREIRKLLRKDIENLQTFLIAVNMGALPLIVICFGIGVYANRARKKTAKARIAKAA